MDLWRKEVAHKELPLHRPLSKCQTISSGEIRKGERFCVLIVQSTDDEVVARGQN